MYEVTIVNALIYTLTFTCIYYTGLCLYVKKIIVPEFKKLFFYITIFCLLGVSGEVLVNNVWQTLFSVPLWEYHLFPAHSGDISYFFVFIWGGLGFYRYLNDATIHNFQSNQQFKPGFIMGVEAVFLELAYNGFFLLLFGSYIFYYLPANLGIFSHLSCLQVIPFYFLVGLFTSSLIFIQNKIGYGKNFIITISLYWMAIASIALF